MMWRLIGIYVQFIQIIIIIVLLCVNLHYLQNIYYQLPSHCMCTVGRLSFLCPCWLLYYISQLSVNWRTMWTVCKEAPSPVPASCQSLWETWRREQSTCGRSEKLWPSSKVSGLRWIWKLIIQISAVGLYTVLWYYKQSTYKHTINLYQTIGWLKNVSICIGSLLAYVNGNISEGEKLEPKSA